jgi:hypothetical protein
MAFIQSIRNLFPIAFVMSPREENNDNLEIELGFSNVDADDYDGSEQDEEMYAIRVRHSNSRSVKGKQLNEKKNEIMHEMEKQKQRKTATQEGINAQREELSDDEEVTLPFHDKCTKNMRKKNEKKNVINRNFCRNIDFDRNFNFDGEFA